MSQNLLSQRKQLYENAPVSSKTSNSSDFSVLPQWYDELSPLGSAVRYIATLSPYYHWVGIYIWNGKKLVLGPYLGAETPHTSIALGQGICGTALLKNADLNIPDVSKEKNYLACSLETKSELVVIVRNKKGSVLGQIDIDSHELNAFTKEDEKKIKIIADELGVLWKEEKK